MGTTWSLNRGGIEEGKNGSLTTTMGKKTLRGKTQGPMIDDIPGYILPRKLGEPSVWMNKNQMYTNIPPAPKGVYMMTNKVPRLRKLQYRNHAIFRILKMHRGNI